MRYKFLKISVLGIVIFIIGFSYIIQGIIIQYHLADINHSYRESEIKNGCYIEYDIAKEQLLGKFYSEANGTIRYGPYCDTNALSSVQTYLVAINEDADYYVPLIISRQYQKDFREIINSDTTYHVLGKFVKSKNTLHYDTIEECTGIKNKSDIHQIISADYQIKIIDLKEERKTLYKGLLLLIAGLLILFVTVKKETA